MAILLVVACCCVGPEPPVRRSRAVSPDEPAIVESSSRRGQRKPPWVTVQVLRLKALAPHLGARKIAEVFNRLFEDRRHTTVGKSFVAALLRKHKLEVLRLRREIKHRVPRSMPSNCVWGLDLTGKTDLSGRQRMILGLLDHGSRACLRLRELADKSSLAIVRELIAVMRQFGIPRFIRTDNETCFTSRTMWFAMRLLGVRLQRTQPSCPWQNGRIERLFGTLKQVLDRIAATDGAELVVRLIEFRCWYNHVRPHQHLDGHTPAEVWAGRTKSRKRPLYFRAWDGLLSGWYFPP